MEVRHLRPCGKSPDLEPEELARHSQLSLQTVPPRPQSVHWKMG